MGRPGCAQCCGQVEQPGQIVFRCACLHTKNGFPQGTGNLDDYWNIPLRIEESGQVETNSNPYFADSGTHRYSSFDPNIHPPNEDKFEKKLAKIELEEKLYGRANMELVAKARMREISTWSKLKKEFHDNSFDDQDVNTHQAESYMHQLEQKKLTLTPGSSQPEVFNVLGQLETLKRVRQSGELKYDGANRKSISKKQRS